LPITRLDQSKLARGSFVYAILPRQALKNDESAKHAAIRGHKPLTEQGFSAAPRPAEFGWWM
jgi:hypothetical protein